jgi:predicted site-specific integrase-resolvase
MNNLITYGIASDWVGVSIRTLQPWQKHGIISSILTPSEHRLKVDKRLPKGRQFYQNKFS